MLTRFVLRRGAAVSVGRLFATSVPRWNVPTSVAAARLAKRKEIDVLRARKAVARKEQAVVRASLEMVMESTATAIKARPKKTQRIAANIVARKAKRVAVVAARQRKEKLDVKGEEGRELSNFYTRFGFVSKKPDGSATAQPKNSVRFF